MSKVNAILNSCNLRKIALSVNLALCDDSCGDELA